MRKILLRINEVMIGFRADPEKNFKPKRRNFNIYILNVLNKIFKLEEKGGGGFL